MSISTEIDLLITNMIISSRLDASFPVKVAKNINIEKKCQMTEYIDIALSNLGFFFNFFFYMFTFIDKRHKSDIFFQKYENENNITNK